MIRNKVEQLERTITSSLYAPDLSTLDYHMFRSMALFFRGMRFSHVDDLEWGCSVSFYFL